jgi:hypothetical protein
MSITNEDSVRSTDQANDGPFPIQEPLDADDDDAEREAESTVATTVEQVLSQLRDRQWGSAVKHIRYSASYPQNGADAVATNIVDIDGDRIRWEITRLDEQPIETEVICLNEKNAFRVKRVGTISNWNLVDFQRAGSSREYGTNLDAMLHEQVMSLHRIPYGFYNADFVDAGFLKKFDLVVENDSVNRSLNLTAVKRKDEPQDRTNPFTNLKFVVDENSFFVRSYEFAGSYEVHGYAGLHISGFVEFLQHNEDGDLPPFYRWKQTAVVNVPSQGIQESRIVMAVIEVRKSPQVKPEAFFLSYYGLDEPNGPE